jgi:hypothetical protein
VQRHYSDTRNPFIVEQRGASSDSVTQPFHNLREGRIFQRVSDLDRSSPQQIEIACGLLSVFLIKPLANPTISLRLISGTSTPRHAFYKTSIKERLQSTLKVAYRKRRFFFKVLRRPRYDVIPASASDFHYAVCNSLEHCDVNWASFAQQTIGPTVAMIFLAWRTAFHFH